MGNDNTKNQIDRFGWRARTVGGEYEMKSSRYPHGVCDKKQNECDYGDDNRCVIWYPM